MSLKYNVEYDLKDRNRLSKAIRKGIEDMLTAMANDILKEAQENLVKNESWVTGKLAQSGRVEYTGSGYLLEATVLFGAIYAAAVEYGTAPHWVPLGPDLKHKVKKLGTGRYELKLMGTPSPMRNPLDHYVVRKMKSREIRHCKWGKKYYGVHTVLGFEIWKAIGIGGTQPKPYFRPAIELITKNQMQYAKKYWAEI